MRRALLRQMPAITRFYGVKPWELDQFTFDELNEYIRQMSEYHDRLEADAARARQRRRG